MYRALPEWEVYLYIFSKSVMCADSLKVSHFYANNFSAAGYEEIIQCWSSAATQASAAPRAASAPNNFVITIHFKLFAQNMAFFQALTIFTAAQITFPTQAGAGTLPRRCVPPVTAAPAPPPPNPARNVGTGWPNDPI